MKSNDDDDGDGSQGDNKLNGWMDGLCKLMIEHPLGSWSHAGLEWRWYITGSF